ncbi:hypothetical protein [Hyphomonas sp.]|jgi:hypothetical protein|nr:hypothetical protein [Hyphomonas sp.]
MGSLTIDPLAIAALVGFGTLLVVVSGITIWLVVQATKSAGEK